MPGAHFSVQNHIGSRLKLIAVWAVFLLICFTEISRAVVYSKNSLSNLCAILSRWQLQLGFKKKMLLKFFSFFVPHMYTFKCSENNWILSILEAKSFKPIFELAVVELVSTK